MQGSQKLRELLSAYRPQDEDERDLLGGFERLLGGGGPIFSRAHFEPGHLTASALIVDSSRKKLGLIFHKKLGLWLQPGGHFDEDERDPIEAARREAAEEIGLKRLEPLSEALFDLDIHEIPARRDEPAHLHHDLRFAFIAAPDEAVRIEEREVSDFAFVDLLTLVEGRFYGETDRSVRRAAKKLLEALS